MSTISGSTADNSVKYQRLSVEFIKLRNQVSVLKTGLLDEQAKNEDQQHKLNIREQKLRKITNENDSLLFRNEQLVKRVEALQTSLDDTNAIFLLAKNKKKHKEANLRLFGETSRQQTLNAPDPESVLKQELERKLAENCELHSKIFDMEKQNDSTLKKLTQRISCLEVENLHLKKLSDDRCMYASVNSFSPLMQESLVSEEDKDRTLFSTPILPQEKNMLNENEHNSLLLENGGPACKTLKEDRLNESNFLEKIKHLATSLRCASGRAEYYKQECESLIRRNLNELNIKKILEIKLQESNEKAIQLSDSLETTRQNYESQMRGLYEHMAEQDAKIVEQSERLLKGVTWNSNRTVNEKKENASTLSQNLRKIVGK